VHPNFVAWSETPVPERRLFRIPGARLWGSDGIVVLPDGSLAAESVYDRHHLERNPAYRKPMPRRSRTVEGAHFSLLGPFSNRGNYFHWFHDALLRLHGVQERLPAGTRYLVPPRVADFQRESLRLLGVPDESLVTYQGELWQPDQLWFASLPPAGAQVFEAVQWLRDRMWSAAGVGSPGLRRRIYISRAGARWGRIANEHQLLPVLDRFGFEVVACEQLSVAEQVRVFSDARTIVSPLGAGQTNALFTPPGAKILQILEPSAENRFFLYWGLAGTCGQPYHYLIGTTVPNPDWPQYPDLELSPERLELALEAVVG
jgi:capsular polysaccharide biosynthesis protein